MQADLRKRLRDILDAALAAVAPDGALARHVRREGDRLYIGEERYELKGRRLLAIGAGKGAAPMAAALEELLGDDLTEGHVVVKEGHGLPLARIRISEAGHPVPDTRGEKATRELLAAAGRADEQDMVLCLFTGGASALTPAPAPGLTLEDMRAVTNLLLECGADIHDMNAVRKHLSAFSGGRLAATAAPARIHALIVSDVVGDDPDVIASGPTAPDASTFARCMEIVRRFGIEKRLPIAISRHLAAGFAGEIAETPKIGDPLFTRVRNTLIATNKQALEAAARTAKKLGCIPRILTDSLRGESSVCATRLTEEAIRAADALRPGDAPLCLLFGGETTLNLRGTGKGGRNQEMAIAASLRLRGRKDIVALFADTDGTDGPTDAAGGFACGGLVERAEQLGLSARAFLDNNDSYNFLQACDALLMTGPTRTNVMGMGIFLVHAGADGAS